MPRVKRGPAGRNKRKKLLDRAEGFFGSARKTVKVAREYTHRADRYAYRDRKTLKREMRYLWQMPVYMDNTRLRNALGAEPHTPMDTAVRNTLAGLGCLPDEQMKTA